MFGGGTSTSAFGSAFGQPKLDDKSYSFQGFGTTDKASEPTGTNK